MRAAWRDKYGGPGVVSIRQLETPSPTGNQILVRVKAASVNRADLDGLYPRWNFIKLFYGLRAPRERWKRLGVDVGGTVEAGGEGVPAFQAGDGGFGDVSLAGAGAVADYVCFPI